jgi:hypothetical protein
VVIAAATVASGATQMLAPGFVLRLFESPDTRAGRQFFGTVGMFMTIVGGSLLQRLVTGDADPDELWWAAVQKFGASAAVGLGIRRKVFSRRAIPVATFDLVSGLACLAHRRRLLNGASGPGR